MHEVLFVSVLCLGFGLSHVFCVSLLVCLLCVLDVSSVCVVFALCLGFDLSCLRVFLFVSATSVLGFAEVSACLKNSVRFLKV